ncbi:MAG: Ig-like domain-containing protein [bacterium]
MSNGGVWYCPVPVADTTLGIQVTKDGYVADATSFLFSSDRTAATDGQISATTGAVKTAFKITSIMSDGNVDITLTATGVVTGDAQGTTCTLNAGAWYCPMPVANTTLAIQVTKDGYVQDITSLSFNTDRVANADAQVSATTGTVKTAYKITSIMTDGNVDITLTATEVKTGDAQGTTCALYSGAWYCPVPVADTTLAIQVTKDGYVQDIVSLAFTGDRAAQTSAQETATNGGTVKTAYRITSIPTDSGVDIVATATGVKAGDAQGTTCVSNAGAWYCPVPVADTTLGIQATLDGYVQDATSLVFNTDRTAATDGQQSLTTGSVKTAFKITAITTDGNVAIINTGETVSAGNAQATVCVLNGGEWYCPVPVADTTLGIQVTKDGYVADATSFLFSSDRTAATDGQISATTGAVKTAFKITSIMSDGNVNITLTATGVVTGDAQGTTCALNAGAWYCPMPVANTTLAIQVTLDGYVQDITSLSFNTDRVANTDAQVSATTGTVKTAYKISSIVSDGNVDITTTATGVKTGDAQGTTCLLYSGAWYCPVPVADTTLAIQVTKDGYVQDITSLAFTGDRAAQTSAQETATAGAVKTAYMIASIMTDGNVDITATATGVKTGNAQGTVCVSNAGAWYCPAPLADTTLAIQVTLDGYVQDVTSLAFNTDRTAVTDGQQSAKTGAVKTAYKITSIPDELTPATELINTGETVSAGDAHATVCVFNVNAWYCPVPVASANLGVYVANNGYISDQTSLVFTSDRAAQTDSQVAATTGGIKYAFKISADDELGSAVTLTDLNSALTGANLTVISTKSMSGLLYVAGTTTGVGDFTLSRTGFVNSTTTAGTYQYVNTAQQAIAYTGALALKYGLKVTVYDETGRPASYCTATHNNLPPKFADQGPNNNIYYFDTVGAANLKIIKAGFQTIGIIPTTNLVTPGGGAVAQTVIELTGRTSGDIGTVLGGQTKIANGIKFATNVLVKVAHEGDPTGLTGLGNLTNFFFEDAVGSRVTPTMFIEVDPSNQPGAYQFKVPTTAAVLKIKDVDFDSDPYVDFDESAPVNLVGLTDTTLTDYGTSTLNFAVDHIALSANSQFAAGANDVVTITLFNNDGATMTTGIHANTEVEVELAGGSVTPPTQKDYSGASLTANSFRTSGGSKFIKGGLTAGSATVTVTDNVITGDTNKLLLSVAGTSGIWPQKAASNTVDLPIKVVTAAPSKIIVINPSDLSTDATATVVLQVQDARGNVVATDTIFRVTVSGSARITGSTPAGQIILQSAVNDVRVMAANGIVTLSVKDSVAETVDINVFDDVMFYGLNDDSTQNVVFSPGAPVSVVFVTPAPTTQTVTQAITVGVQIRDAGGNVVTTSSEAFTVKALGSPTPSLSTAMFTSITAPATIVSGVNTNTVAVRAANGVVSLSLTDNTAETVILSIEGTTLNASSQTSVSFTSGAVNKLVIKYNPADLTLIAGGAPTGYIVQVQDAQGNPITLAADLTVNLTTSQTTTGKFYATSAGTTPVTSITVATGANSNYFYYRDTKATTSLTGQTHLTTSGTGVFSDGIDINVNPATPVTGYTVVTASSTEPEQPTGVKNRQTVSINDSDGLRTLVLVDYPYTSAASQIDRIVADGFTRGIIRIEAKDKYGNAISGKQVSFITTMGGVTKSGLINPAADMTDTDGKARFEITSTEIGDVIVTVRITDGSVITYGEMFTVRFKPDDRTPPEITRYSSDKTAILDGDYIAAAGPIRIHVSITDPGLNPSGVDLSSIQVSVKNTATNQTYSGTTPSLTGCVVESNCLIEWNPPTSLPAGPYEVSLSVSDRNANIQTKKWSVAVEGGTVLRNVMAGPGVFDPRNGGSMQIGFQSPQDGAIVRLEIFDRSGQIINTQIMTAQAGYNAFDWNGRESSGDIPGNGIYVFRITASIGGQSVSQKGKFAIFKR